MFFQEPGREGHLDVYLARRAAKSDAVYRTRLAAAHTWLATHQPKASDTAPLSSSRR